MREFQRRVGISVDGIVGDETRRTLGPTGRRRAAARGRYGVTF